MSKVRASEIPVLTLEAQPEHAGRLVAAEALRAEADDRISAVILGCAGMVEVVETVRAAVKIETIDPVACAARCMTWLAGHTQRP